MSHVSYVLCEAVRSFLSSSGVSVSSPVGGGVPHWYRPYKGLRGLIWKENVISRGEWPKVVLPVDYSTYRYHM